MTTAQQARAERGAMVLQAYDPDPADRLSRILTDLAAYAAAEGLNFEGAASLAALRASGMPS